MENVRIIKLNPNTYISNVSTFDEAFDEYSDASGKRIKKRAERQRAKAELQEAKAQKKVARVGKRTARKVAKSEGRDTTASMRQARRRQRIAEAQARKTDRAEAVQSRRTGRKTARLERRALGEELEPEIDETLQGSEDDTIIDDVNETNGNGGGYDEPVRGLPPEGYAEEEEDYQGGYAPESDEFGAEPDYNEDDNDVNYSNDEEYGDEYNSYQSDEEDPTGSGFDGSVKNDDEFSDLEQASQVIDIPDAITVVADKIEWNKELYSRLDGKKKEIISNNALANIDELDSQMRDRGNRIVDLEELLDGWANCKYNYDGNNQFQEFPLTDIDYANADGKNKFAKMKRSRYKVLSKAKENAKKKREKVTLVKTTLNPIFENGRIVVPSANPSSGFEGIPQGTGLNGLDNSNDYDAPPIVDIELTSNADGTSKMNINGILLGVGIAIVGIWAIRKYKLIK
jgi:hypothetical protein